MKKLISVLLVLSVILALAVIFPADIYAAVTASLSGPSELRARDAITLTLRLSPGSTKVSGVSGEFSFSSSQVSLVGNFANPPSGWKVETGDKTFIAYDDSTAMNKHITGSNVRIFTVQFKVNSNAATGSNINISVRNITISYKDANNEHQSMELGTVNYSVTVAPPKSGNNNLKSLTVSNANISPAFSKDVLNYQTTVPFSVSSLNITAVPEDAKASVSISGNNLKVGNNTVIITVTAENGSKKEYKINVVREQDPNYVPASEARLKSLGVAYGGLLSPEFSQDVTSYVIYLPYEVDKLDFTGEPLDSKATVEGLGIKELAEGVNIIKITVTAEDGKTTKEYVITAVRMPRYDGSNPVQPSGSPEPGKTEDPGKTNEPETAAPHTAVPGGSSESGVALALVIVLCAIFLLLGAGIGILAILMLRKRKI